MKTLYAEGARFGFCCLGILLSICSFCCVCCCFGLPFFGLCFFSCFGFVSLRLCPPLPCPPSPLCSPVALTQAQAHLGASQAAHSTQWQRRGCRAALDSRDAPVPAAAAEGTAAAGAEAGDGAAATGAAAAGAADVDAAVAGAAFLGEGTVLSMRGLRLDDGEPNPDDAAPAPPPAAALPAPPPLARAPRPPRAPGDAAPKEVLSLRVGCRTCNAQNSYDLATAISNQRRSSGFATYHSFVGAVAGRARPRRRPRRYLSRHATRTSATTAAATTRTRRRSRNVER